jgi:asparagine synthase (glutamine-hydrolysing)
VSTIAILTKNPDQEHLVQKALETMRVHQDEDSDIIMDGNTAIGYIGSLATAGKNLALKQLETGTRITIIATTQLLKDASNIPYGPKEEDAVTDILIGVIANQKQGWSLIGTNAQQLLAGRDAVGQHPLFWGRSNELTAVASEKKALWSLGIPLANCVSQGTILELGDSRQKESRIGRLIKPEPSPIEMDQAAVQLLNILRASIKRVTDHSEKIGVLFSGGLDSSTVAAVANGLGLQTRLYTAAFERSSDIKVAEKAAELLNLELEVETIPLDESLNVLKKVVWEIESCNPVQVCVGMPIEVATRSAVSKGEQLLLSGSGADELFGGYSKYLNVYRVSGEGEAEDLMYRDILGLGSRDLLRDGAIGEVNRVQLCAPFLDLKMVEFGLKIPVSLKLKGAHNGLGKIVLRRAAEIMGMPKEICDSSKKAAQYSSRSLSVVKKLAKRECLSLHGYLESIFKDVFPYHPEASE